MTRKKMNIKELRYVLATAEAVGNKDEARRLRRNLARRERDQAMRDLGLVRVRGALGRIYWE
jgi:hypothetical protein